MSRKLTDEEAVRLQAPSSALINATYVDPRTDLDRERRLVSFPIKEVTHALYGGPEKATRRRFLADVVAKHPNFNREDMCFMSRTELHYQSLKHDFELRKLTDAHNTTWSEAFWMHDQLGHALPTDVHTSMFEVTLQSQCDEEQAKYWLPRVKRMEVVGTYAQTELGHGTYLRGLETTATYVKETQEFILHSVTPASLKWWPGGLGKTVNHCVVMARLILDGKDYGPHGFIVQLRRFEDHMPLPGVEVGDIGPKFGYNTIDNGYLRLNHVRVPRTNMLARFASVTPDGKYIRPPHAKANYATMVFVRAGIVDGASFALSKAVTIAIRYSLVRRQGELEANRETQVLDFQQQQHTLFSLLATAYALNFTGQSMMALYNSFVAQRDQGDFSNLPEVHATTACLKAVTTWFTSDGIEACRKCCGGHGYHHFSGLPQLLMEYAPNPTFEGDNIVLCLQAARYLVRAALLGRKDPSKLLGSMKYLGDLDRLLTERSTATCEKCFLDANVQLAAFRHRAAALVAAVAGSIAARQKEGISEKQAFNEHAVDLVNAARAHGAYLVVLRFIEAVTAIPDASPAKAPIKRLSDLFALSLIERDHGDFTLDGFLSLKQLAFAKRASRALLTEIRKDAIGYVDAFDLTDFSLNSSLGRYDGNIYEDMYRRAQREPLNKSHLPPGYEEFLKPKYTQSLSKL